MKPLLEYLNEVSKERGFRDFQHATTNGLTYVVEDIIKESGVRHSTEYAKEALTLASENAEFIAEHQFYEETIKDSVDNVGSHLVFVDKQSILSENNLPKHR